MSAVIATVTRGGAPIEGMQLDFAAVDQPTVSVQTDASGVFIADLVPDVTYAVGIIGACEIDGSPMAAVTVVRLQVPVSETPVALVDVALHTLSTDWPTLLVRLETAEQQVATLHAQIEALTARVAMLEVVP